MDKLICGFDVDSYLSTQTIQGCSSFGLVFLDLILLNTFFYHKTNLLLFWVLHPFIYSIWQSCGWSQHHCLIYYCSNGFSSEGSLCFWDGFEKSLRSRITSCFLTPCKLLVECCVLYLETPWQELHVDEWFYSSFIYSEYNNIIIFFFKEGKLS